MVINRSIVSLPRSVIRLRGYKTLMLASAAAYWLFYAISDNMIQYYPVGFNLASVFKGIGTPSVIGWFYVPWPLVDGWYYSGVEWYPNGHLEVNLFLGATFFSVLLALLFGLNIAMFAYLVSTRRRNRKMGLTGFLGMIPALFSSGMPCCSAPLGTVLLSALVPSGALVAFSVTYGPVTNIVITLAMLLSIFYISRKVASLSSGNPL